MNIRTEVSETEKHVKSLASTAAEQIAIIRKAQSLAGKDEHAIMIYAIVKNRIIRESEATK